MNRPVHYVRRDGWDVYALGKKIKDDGDAALKDGYLKDAVQIYHEFGMFFSTCLEANPEIDEQHGEGWKESWRTLASVVSFNLALTHLRAGNGVATIQEIATAIEDHLFYDNLTNDSIAKAHYLSGLAYAMLERWSSSVVELSMAHMIFRSEKDANMTYWLHHTIRYVQELDAMSKTDAWNHERPPINLFAEKAVIAWLPLAEESDKAEMAFRREDVVF
ncbi:MAG: hypothetical protein M1827_007527 [Pycnora praestabilis]|nr:MAG: hypothetical protein M1827_007527 [Pycnora praestabilis]